jgi:ATP-binding cassette, subfamily B, bacterial
MFKLEGKNEFLRVMSFMKPRNLMYWTGLIGGCAMQAGLGIMIAFMMKDLFNGAVKGDMGLLWKAGSLALISIIFLGTFSPFVRYLHNASLKRTMADIRFKAFKHIQELPSSYYESRHSGDVISRVTNDIQVIEQIFSGQMYMLVVCLLNGLSSAFFMLLLDWRMAIALILLGILTAYVNTRFAEPMRKVSDKIQANMGTMTERLTDLLAGFHIIKMFPIENLIMGRYKDANSETMRLCIRKARIGAFLDSTNFLLVWLSFGGALSAGAYMILYKYMDFGTMLAVINLLNGVVFMFTSLGNFIAQIQGSLGGANRVFELLDEPVEPERYVLKKTEDTAAMVELQDIGFSYNGTDRVLDGVSLSIGKGQMAALVGPSGGGKSTVLKMLLGYYTPQEGNIVVNAKSIGQYSLTELRDMMAYVPQDAYLFDGTVEENIWYGRPKATREEVIAAAEAANAHGFITELPEGYATKVGERGTRLSGGQKQRIAIARALLKNAPILLLDEATSALDSESEQLVQDALNRLMQGRTTIAVAHRLSTIRHADVIYVIEGGEVVEKGNHTELAEGEGLYNRLYELQFKLDTAEAG